MATLRTERATDRSARGLLRRIGAWQIWSLREPLRSYLIGVTAVALILTPLAVSEIHWHVANVLVFVGLIGCGIISIESTHNIKETHGAIVRDLQPVWYLAIAVTLPPAYALAAPVPLTAYKLWRQPGLVFYRRVFSNATISLAYGGASWLFHGFRPSIAGAIPGSGLHVLTWTGVVALCGAVAWAVNATLVITAIRISDPALRIRDLVGNREAATSDLIELSLAVSLALVVSINPILMALALPSIVLYRRYLMQAQLVAQARMDTKTGLLNAGTWRREAEVEFFRALRSGAPLALVVVDIDHFESVNETAGLLGGDQVLRNIATTLTENLSGRGLVGRVGGEEYAILLPQIDELEAKRIGERIRDHIAAEPIAIEDGSHAGFVFRLTVSIGIAVLNHSRRALGELMGAADLALSEAKSTGRNRVCVDPGPVNTA